MYVINALNCEGRSSTRSSHRLSEGPVAGAYDLCLITGVQLWWKGQLGAYRKPPCQNSLWEETGDPQLSVERWVTVFA
jgi:hypothetical protein